MYKFIVLYIKRNKIIFFWCFRNTDKFLMGNHRPILVLNQIEF